MKNLRILILIVITVNLIGCSYEPEPINFGHDECVLCKMSITDKKYGAEIVNTKGKPFKFDALECMAKYIVEKEIDSDNIHSVWTVDYTNPGQLINAETAFYLRSFTLPSPMAMFFTSFPNESELKKVMEEHPGEILNWQQVLSIVEEEWH